MLKHQNIYKEVKIVATIHIHKVRLVSSSSMLQLLPLVVELLVIVDGGLLVLLVLGDQVVHVGLRLGELHLVHAFASVPVKESLDSLQHLVYALKCICFN